MRSARKSKHNSILSLTREMWLVGLHFGRDFAHELGRLERTKQVLKGLAVAAARLPGTKRTGALPGARRFREGQIDVTRRGVRLALRSDSVALLLR